MKLENKIAIVTGASTGIGKAVAIALAREGVHVYLVARTVAKLAEVEKEIKEAGGIADMLPADLSSLDSVNELISLLNSKTDRVDILANIAGVWHGPDEVYAGKRF
jgi:3-oxoacyl-[acyl-carrier protein] reductase